MRAIALGSLSLFGLACGSSGNAKPDGAVGATLAVSSVSPDHGSMLGGTTLTISGDFLVDDETHVLVGDREATVMDMSSEAITAVTPEGTSSGSVTITIFNRRGFGALEDSFSYNPMPTVTDIAPPGQAPGMSVTITGTGFQVLEAGENIVALGETECVDVDVSDDETLTCTVGEDGGTPYAPATVTVTNENGTGVLEHRFKLLGEGLLIADQGRNSVTPKLYFVDPLADKPTVHVVDELTTDGMLPGIRGMARRGQAVYGVTRNPRTLITLEPATATMTEVAPLTKNGGGTPNIKDLMFTGGTLYGYERNGSLNSIDTATGTATEIGGPIGSHAIADMADGTALVNWRGNETYSIVDLATGEVASTFDGPDASHAPMKAMTRYKGKIYGLRRGLGIDFGAGPGGGGGAINLVEIDPVAQTHTLITIIPSADAHAMCSAPF